MEIKIGDIVQYAGQRCRVMRQPNIAVDYEHRQFEIRCNDFKERVYPSHVALIESVNIPEFVIGDIVHVDDVPGCERRYEDGFWVTEMDDYIGNDYQVTDYDYNSEFGPIVKLGEWWFNAWHLIPVVDYDIV